MRQIKKHAALLLAGLICTAGTGCPFPLPAQTAAETESVLAFAKTVLPQLHPTDEYTFLNLHYSAEEAQLYLDGRPAGTAAAGFRIENGTLVLDASAAGAPAQAGDVLTLEQAEQLLGCEVHRSGADIDVTSPFQRAELLVKADAAFDSHGAETVSAEYDGLRVLQYASPAEAYRAYQTLPADDAVQFAEPNRILHIAELPETAFSADSVATDNWGYRAIGAESFHADYLQDSDTAVKVAVIDTGIYAEHNWFAGRIAPGGTSFCAEDGGQYTDLHSHGTHCAGIICNATTPNVSILPLKALGADGYGSTLAIYCAMIYAMEQNADVISMSLTGYGYSPLIGEAVAALAAAEIPCVVAAGNDGDDVRYYEPANIPSVIAVASVGGGSSGDAYTHSYFSNYGEFVDFCAPGERIESAGIASPDATAFKTGTSMATPMVAACCANLLQYDSTLSVAQLYEYLRVNALDLGEEGFDTDYGWGMVNLRDFTFTDGSCAAPEVNLEGGDYSEMLSLRLSCADANAQICYTTDGSIPEAGRAVLYDGGVIPITKTTDLRAIAFTKSGSSRMLHAQYRISCSAPEFSLPEGAYTAPVSVSISAPSGAAVYYTTNGDLPSPESGLPYAGETLALTETTVLRAAAYIGETASPVMTAVYLIGGQGYEKLFQIENGCLTAYFGALTELDLLALLPDAGITAIGDGVFADQDMLTRVVLPDSVTVIGARAFAGCTALSELICPWEMVQDIGDAAFAGSAVSGTLHLDALQTLGAHAFAETDNLEAVLLPPQITVLPEGVFMNSGLEQLSAPGVTEVGADALYAEHASALRMLELPFDRLTAVGARAFSNVSLTEAGVPDPEFAALKTVGAYAFANAECNTMTFPAWNAVSSHALEACAAAMLYLPAAETVSAFAISFAGEGKTGVAVGEALQWIAVNGIREPDRAAVYAGPEDSPLHTFAAENAAAYLRAPAVYMPVTEITAMQDTAPVIYAYPIGTQTDLRWYAPDGTALPASYRYGMYPSTEETGTVQYTVCLEQNGVEIGAAQTVTVHTAAADQTGVISGTDVPVMVRWETETASRAMYQFTAPQAGAYYIFAEDSATDVCIRRGNGQTFTQRGSGEKPELLRHTLLAADETVQILLQQRSAGVPAFLMVTETAPQDTIAGATFIPAPAQTMFARGAEIELPNPELAVRSPEGDISAQLRAGTDYVLMTAPSVRGASAYAYACGIGSYSGLCTQELLLYDDLMPDQPLILEQLTEETRYYQFCPEISGTYTIFTDFTEAALAAPEQYDIRSYDTALILYDDILRVLTASDENADSRMGQVSCELQAGSTYYIAVSAASGSIPAVQLRAVSGNAIGNIQLAEISVPEAVVYPFAPYEPVCTVYDANGKLLTEGTDYTKRLLHNRLPGRMTVLIHGIGGYYGTAAANITILPISAQTAPDAVLALDTSVVMSNQTGLYQFDIAQTTEAYLRPDTDALWEAAVYRQSETDGAWTEYLSPADLAADTPMYLTAGAYMLLIYAEHPCSLMLETERVYKCFADARIRVSPLNFTGRPLEPEFTVTVDGLVLEEGQDYTVSLHAPVIALGKYSAELTGCGDYVGTKTVSFSVRPDAAQAYPLAAEGENTVQITAAGTAQIFRWIPQSAHCCIVKTDPLVESIAVFDGNGYPVAALEGMDYQYAECSVRIGKSYYIVANYAAAVYAGTFTFSLLSDYTLLADCVPEAPELIPYVPDGAVPAYSLKDGGNQLQAGRDYLVRFCGDETMHGRAEILLQGIGRYVGMLYYWYYQYPALSAVQNAVPETVLTQDQPVTENCGHPSDMHLYRFSAARAGTYYLHVPTSEEDAVCTVIYDADGNVLPMETRMLRLDAGETVYLLCITDWLEASFELEDEYQIMVSAAPPPLIYEENGYVYLLAEGCATLLSVPEDMIGLHLPETVCDPVNAVTCTFTGIAPECLERIAAQCTVYGAAGGIVDAYCAGAGLCFAAEDAVCTVRGDVTGDGVCDAADALTLLRWLTESRGMVLSSSAWECADCNGDGEVTELDAVLMLQPA